jgi:uncharacterized delta-60 repeat protein
MAKHGLGVTSGLLVMAVGAALVVGCGDDGGSDEGDGGESGSSDGSGGSKAGSGGAGGSKAGSSSGGSNGGGKAGSGGSETNGGVGGEGPDMGGAGGAKPDPIGGAGGTDAGAGGEGGDAEPTFAPVSEVHDQVFTQASDLRGLRFSATGGKIWASGHLGINANPSVPADPDKKLVVARFNADGTPDATFGGDGFMDFNLALRVQAGDVITNDGNEESIGLVELTNGDIVVSANVRDVNGKGMDAVLARFTSEGAPVTSFGDDGVARVTFGWETADDASWPTLNAAPSDSSWGVELDKHGNQERLVVFGFGAAAKGQMTGTPAAQRTDNDRYIARRPPRAGAPDPEFNGGTAFTYNTGGTFGDNGRRGIVEADGSILAGGYTNFGVNLGNHIIAIHLNPDGTRDMGFGFGIVDNGVARTNPLVDDGGAAECYGIARQSTGRIITTGYGAATAANTPSSFGYATTTAPDLVSFAITADGKGIDEDWGNLGMLVVQSEETALERKEDRGRDVAVLGDDRLVYVGNFGTDPAIFIATPNGEFDPANGVGQIFTYDPLTVTVTANGTSTSHFYRVLVSPDGQRIAASSSQNVDGARLAVLKVGE